MKKILLAIIASSLFTSCAMMQGEKLPDHKLYLEKIYTYPNITKNEILKELKTQNWHLHSGYPDHGDISGSDDRIAMHFTERVKGGRFKWQVKGLVVFDVFDNKMRVRIYPSTYKHRRDRTIRKVRMNPVLNNYQQAVLNYSDKIDQMIRQAQNSWSNN